MLFRSYEQKGYDEDVHDYYFDEGPNFEDMKKECLIKRIHIDKATVKSGEPIHFTVYIDSKEPKECTLIRSYIKTQSDFVVGMTYSEPFSLKKGSNEIDLTIDTKMYGPGGYAIDPILSEYTDGILIKQHGVGGTMPFSVEETEFTYNFPWPQG